MLYSYLLFALPVERLEASTVALLLLVTAPIQCPNLFFASTRRHRKPWFLFFAFLLIGVAFSELPQKSLKGAYDCLRAALVFFVGFFFVRQIALDSRFVEKLRTFSIVVVLAVTTFCAVSVVTSGNVWLRDNQLVQEVWRNLHEFANLVAVNVLVLGFVVWCRGLDRVSGLCLMVLIGVLILTTSRGNLLAVTFSLGFLFAFGHRYRMLLWWFALLTALAFFVYAFFLHSGICFGDMCPGYTYEARKIIYQQVISQVEMQPWTGYGLNVFKHLSGIQLEGRPIVMPNSAYLELLYSVGVIGFFALLLFVAVMLRVTRAEPPVSGSPAEVSPWRVFALMYAIYFLMRGLVDFKLVSFEFLGAIFLALGMRVGAWYREKEAPSC